MDLRRDAAPPLHNAFYLGAKKEFKRLLAKVHTFSGGGAGGGGGGGASGGGGGGPSSGPRSWSQQHMHLAGRDREEKVDLNARDAFGRTVLHLVAHSLDPAAVDYLRLLLDKGASIQINLQDVESGWTALHRALYVGNLTVARMLLAEDRIDTKVKDWEGLTCFDLYNSTVEGTNPPDASTTGDTLYTWGVNRNFVLGGGDGDERPLPDRVSLKRTEKKSYGGEEIKADSGNDARRFDPVTIRQVAMGKLHTGLVTGDRSGNLNLCGFGSGGRLGRTIHSQSDLAPMPDFPYTITSVALGQDHTLALTSSGHILSWGLNRFSVLGYVVEAAPTLGSKFSNLPDEPVQLQPKRIVGTLKKEIVLGVAASRMASACWTEDAVWTWGSNTGNLGYDVGAKPEQVLPRKVAGVSQPVIGIALTDYAMLCLLSTNEVLAFYRSGTIKINFPSHPSFAESAMYRPQNFLQRPQVVKVTSCGITFACLTSLGDVYTFALANPTDADRAAATNGSDEAKSRGTVIKPQRAWALRKKFTAVKDVALGSDGAIILCTQSGHVYVRTRTVKVNASGPPGWTASSSSKAFKFHRIPFLQRVIKVAANESGAFAAIRLDAAPRAIELVGNSVGEDLALLQPHVARWMEDRKGSFLLTESEASVSHADDDGEIESNAVKADVKVALQLWSICDAWKPASSYPPLFGVVGSDCVLHVAGRDTPAHQAILAARSPTMRALLAGEKLPASRISVERTSEGLVRFHLPKSDHFTALLLLHYLYTDSLVAVWDSRIGARVQDQGLASKKLNLAAVRLELKTLADSLELSTLSSALDFVSKTAPSPTLPADLARAFELAQASQASTFRLTADVVISLSDREVSAHSSILRSRSPFFSALFSDPDWTASRRTAASPSSSPISIDLSHLKWSTMRLIFLFLYEGSGVELFDYHHQDSVDPFLDFVFEVLGAANELLLDRLVLICSTVILRHVTIFNVCSLLSSSSFYNAFDLRDSLQLYVAQNLETMLESHLLDAMPTDTLSELASFVMTRQGLRLPISRSGVLVTAAMERQAGWLSLQDIPKPYARPAPSSFTRRAPPVLKSPVLAPVDPSSSTASPRSAGLLSTMAASRSKGLGLASPPATPPVRAAGGADDLEDDDLFTMDPLDGLGSAMASSSLTSTAARPVWKSKAVEAEKTDLRSIMAMAEASKAPAPRLGPSRASFDALPSPLPKLVSTPPSSSSTGSPWRLPAPSAVKPASPFSPPPQAAPSRPAFPSPSPSVPPLSSQRPGGPSPLLTRTSSPRLPPTGSATPPPPARAPSDASGQVIVPVRAPAPSPSSNFGSMRARSSEPAWLTPTFDMTPPPRPVPSFPSLSSSPSSSSSSSFATILAEQARTSSRGKVPAARPTLAAIQAEEHARFVESSRAEEERAEEERFLAWWAEEERRQSGAGAGPGPANGADWSAAAGGRGGKRGGRGGKRGGGGGGGGGGPPKGERDNGQKQAGPGGGSNGGGGPARGSPGRGRAPRGRGAADGVARPGRGGGRASGGGTAEGAA